MMTVMTIRRLVLQQFATEQDAQKDDNVGENRH